MEPGSEITAVKTHCLILVGVDYQRSLHLLSTSRVRWSWIAWKPESSGRAVQNIPSLEQLLTNPRGKTSYCHQSGNHFCVAALLFTKLTIVLNKLRYVYTSSLLQSIWTRKQPRLSFKPGPQCVCIHGGGRSRLMFIRSHAGLSKILVWQLPGLPDQFRRPCW